MKKIIPINIWSNGASKQGVEFSLAVVYDDLTTYSSFYYQILSDIGEKLADGNLTISGEEYTAWTGANEDAYIWSLAKLGLTVVPEETTPSVV